MARGKENYAKEAREKIEEYLRLAAEGSDKAGREVRDDANRIVNDLLDGAVKLAEKERERKEENRRISRGRR